MFVLCSLPHQIRKCNIIRENNRSTSIRFNMDVHFHFEVYDVNIISCKKK